MSALILDKRSEKADEMIIKLAHFLRLGLAADPTRKILLDLELELQRTYLEIEQLRFPDLDVDFNIGKLAQGRARALAYPSADHRECREIWGGRSTTARDNFS